MTDKKTHNPKWELNRKNKHVLHVRVTDEELAFIDKKRGDLTRSAYVKKWAINFHKEKVK